MGGPSCTFFKGDATAATSSSKGVRRPKASKSALRLEVEGEEIEAEEEETEDGLEEDAIPEAEDDEVIGSLERS